MRKFFALPLAALFLSGCAQQTFTINPGASTLAKEEMDVFFLSGIGQAQTMNAAQICGGASRVAKVEGQTDVIDNVIGIFTSGVVTPRKARVYCLR